MSLPKLVFATNNAHKLSEIRAILAGQYEVLSLNEIDCFGDIPETADTLEGNALLKAQFVYTNYGYDCFADDTGLEVEALGGRPGVHTARYAYPDRNDSEANTQLLLKELLFEGVVNGSITTEKRGDKGFGYDPVFVPEGHGLTFAELGTTVKNSISHRARAVMALCEYLKLHHA